MKGQAVTLTPKEFELLAALVDAPGRVFGRTELGSPNRIALQGPLGQGIELKSGKDFATFGLARTGKAAAGLVFVGYGITSEKAQYDDYAGVDVAGKVVVVLRRAPRVDGQAALLDAAEYERVGPYVEKILNAEMLQAGTFHKLVVGAGRKACMRNRLANQPRTTLSASSPRRGCAGASATAANTTGVVSTRATTCIGTMRVKRAHRNWP